MLVAGVELFGGELNDRMRGEDPLTRILQAVRSVCQALLETPSPHLSVGAGCAMILATQVGDTPTLARRCLPCQAERMER